VDKDSIKKSQKNMKENEFSISRTYTILIVKYILSHRKKMKQYLIRDALWSVILLLSKEEISYERNEIVRLYVARLVCLSSQRNREFLISSRVTLARASDYNKRCSYL